MGNMSTLNQQTHLWSMTMKKLLTENEMIAVITNKTINEQTALHRAQIMRFAFGDDYMASNDKGSKVTYTK